MCNFLILIIFFNFLKGKKALMNKKIFLKIPKDSFLRIYMRSKIIHFMLFIKTRISVVDFNRFGVISG
jgi:hypothetical protein